jgi:DNA-binding MarR family transcriptional regulator
MAINEQARMIEEIEAQFDDVSRAVRYSGTEKGRNLAAQKLTLNQNFDLVSVITQAKAKKGKPLTADEKAKFEKLTEQVKAKDVELEVLQKRLRDTEAREAITTRRRNPRRPQEVKRSIADLTEQTRRLLRAGCLTG